MAEPLDNRRGQPREDRPRAGDGRGDRPAAGGRPSDRGDRTTDRATDGPSAAGRPGDRPTDRAGAPPDGPIRRNLGQDALREEALRGHQVAGRLDRDAAIDLLRNGDIEIVGRLLGASNTTLYCIVRERCPEPEDGRIATAVYKPIRGERPLADFPDGTLANREVAAYAVSEASGWNIVPPTILRDGPLGVGMLQLWVEIDDRVDVIDLVGRDDPQLRRIALLDAVLNNADRKGGHLLPLPDGHIQGVDHGLCFAVESKLRTVLWGWRGQRIGDDEAAVIDRLRQDLRGDLGNDLRALLAPAEVRATARRTETLLSHGRFPMPDRNRPVIPWPPF